MDALNAIVQGASFNVDIITLPSNFESVILEMALH